MDYEKKYKEALERARIWKDKSGMPKDKQGILDDIFPELKGSEDERIRKALINQFNDYKKRGENHVFGYSNDKILAWLEKQGEQKPTDKVEPKFRVGNKIKLAIEPKYPAREIIAIKNDAYYFDELVYLPFSRQDEWELVEQTPDWSEEDEKKLNGVILDLTVFIDKAYSKEGKAAYQREIDWLKSIKDRMQSQNTRKLSEEQTESLSHMIDDIGIGYKKDVERF